MNYENYEQKLNQIYVKLGCRFKADCPHMGSEPMGRVLSRCVCGRVENLLKDSIPYLREIQKKTWKNQNS